MDKYNIAAELGFYLGPPEECVNTYAIGDPGLGYRFWTDLRQFENRSAVAVLPVAQEGALARLREHFDSVDELRSVSIRTHGKTPRPVGLVDCHGYHMQARDAGAH